MKKLTAISTILLLTICMFAQVPEEMSFQAIIRNNSDVLVTNTNIGMQISVLQDSASGIAVYVERHFPTTNTNGLVSIEIGRGTVISGSFTGIDWTNGPYFIKTETDLNGGANYTITGISQLLSVPFALHAKSAETVSGSITETDPIFGGSPVAAITTESIANWNNAFDWGNHSSAGYASEDHLHSANDIESGSLSVARGGTGISSYTTGNYLYASGENTLAQRTPAEVRTDIDAGTVSSIATDNGITGGPITTTGTLSLTGQSLALHSLNTNGLIARTASGTVAARTITAGTGITVTNGNGVSNNPVISANNGIDWVNIAITNVDVRTNKINAGSVTITAPSIGFVIVRFDGCAFASAGDNLVLAASNVSQTYGINDGNVSFRGDGYSHPFSHTRVYSVSVGDKTFYAVAYSNVGTGNGKASIYATLSAVYYPIKY